MCELLAMSASRPSGVGHYLSRLMARGGRTGPHVDGWGVAYYEDRAVRIFKEPAPAADSRLLAMLAEDPFTSTALIAHIRLANPSIFGRATGNTHPFEREWNGRSWVFAHNGKLSGLHKKSCRPDSRFLPLGETDSELAFCHILEAVVRGIGRDGRFSPAKLVDTIRPVVVELATFGEFNFILSDGECLYAHAHTNLHVLQRTLSTKGDGLKMILLATAPLTAEPWRAMAPGSIHVYRQGEEVLRARHAARPAKYRPTAQRCADVTSPLELAGLGRRAAA
ncbi:MAG: class II glutamine amidotransferase [Burkholderiales bacterium]